MTNIISSIKRHKKISFVVLAAILIGGYLLLGPTGKKTSATVYTYETVAKGNIVQSVSGSGQVAASDQVAVKSQASGNVTAVNVVAGQAVKYGDVLVQLDSTDAQAAVDVAKANLNSAKLTSQKTSQDNSLSLAQAQQALGQANDSLAQSQTDLSKIYEQAFNAIVSTFADLPAVMSGLNDIMTGSSNVVVQSSGTYFNYYQDQINLTGSSAATISDVAAAYTTAKSSYENVLAEYKSATRYSDPAVISKITNDSYDATKKISNAIKSITNLIQLYYASEYSFGGDDYDPAVNPNCFTGRGKRKKHGGPKNTILGYVAEFNQSDQRSIPTIKRFSKRNGAGGCPGYAGLLYHPRAF